MSGSPAPLCDPEQMLEPLHIAGLSVRMSPSNVRALRDMAGRLPGTEIHAATEDGRIVNTIEPDNGPQIPATIATISGFAGVISLALTFHQVEFPGATKVC